MVNQPNNMKCPMLGLCDVSAADQPPCGSSYDQLPPLLLAKDLCQQALAGMIEVEENRSLEDASHPARAERGRHYRLGCLYLELAQSQSFALDPHASDAHFNTSGRHLEAAELPINGERFRINAEASFLSAYYPAFTAHPQGSSSEEIIEGIQKGLQKRADEAVEIQDSFGERARLGWHLLYARIGTVAYPATARELRFAPPFIEGPDPRAHSFYTIDPVRGHKVPHRTLQGIGGDPMRDVVLAPFGNLAKRAMDKVMPPRGKMRRSEGQAAAQVFQWLHAEVAGGRLSHKEKDVLILMSQALRQRRKYFNQDLARAQQKGN